MVSSRDDLWTKPQKPRPQKTKIYRKSIELLKSSAKIQKISDIRKFWWYFLGVLFFFYFSLLFLPLGVLCAPPLLARFLFLLGFTSDGIRCRKKGSAFLAAFRMFIPRDYIPLWLCLLLRNRIPLFIAIMRRSSMCGFISLPVPYPAGLTEGVSKLLPPPYQ